MSPFILTRTECAVSFYARLPFKLKINKKRAWDPRFYIYTSASIALIRLASPRIMSDSQ